MGAIDDKNIKGMQEERGRKGGTTVVEMLKQQHFLKKNSLLSFSFSPKTESLGRNIPHVRAPLDEPPTVLFVSSKLAIMSLVIMCSQISCGCDLAALATHSMQACTKPKGAWGSSEPRCKSLHVHQIEKLRNQWSKCGANNDQPACPTLRQVKRWTDWRRGREGEHGRRERKGVTGRRGRGGGARVP